MAMMRIATTTLLLAMASAAPVLTASGAATATGQASAGRGTQLWARQYNGPINNRDIANAVAVSPGGATVFITGESTGAGTGQDYATVAYRATTGARLWVSRYTGSDQGNRIDNAHAVAVDPFGKRVYVTGASNGGSATGSDYATIAYNAATGKQLWVSRYNGPGNSNDVAYDVAVSPGGGTVFVTGKSAGTTTGEDFATVAYNAATGARLWVSRFSGPGNAPDAASSVAVSSDGRTVFITGPSGSSAFATVAYRAATGARLWVRSYGTNEYPGNPSSVVVSPDNRTVFVGGTTLGGATTVDDYATVAYNAATGAQEWAKIYNRPVSSVDRVTAIGVNPPGTLVYVTGSSYGGSAAAYQFATVAYNAATGGNVWVTRSRF